MKLVLLFRKDPKGEKYALPVPQALLADPSLPSFAPLGTMFVLSLVMYAKPL
jgi:hypothetical protein